MIRINNRQNRAADPDIENFGNTGKLDVSGFSFEGNAKAIDRFITICEALANNSYVKTITFQKDTNGEGLTFDSISIPTLLLQNDTLQMICKSSQVDRAYFLFTMPIGGDYLLVIEKTKCDSVLYYDSREFSENEARRFIEIIEEEAFDFKRQQFKLIRNNK